MKLLNTFDCKQEAEKAEKKLSGPKRLASERDGTETIYNLFGQATWRNFYALELFDLHELKEIIQARENGDAYSKTRHSEIIKMLNYIASNYDIDIPNHWL